jgi:hypothetical protein
MSLNSTAKTQRMMNLAMQFIAIGVLLGALAIATGVAPVSWIKFERVDGQVKARTQSCVFFIVPYHTVWVVPVEKLETDIVKGSAQRKHGRDIPGKKADDVGYLNIIGPGQLSEVPIAPSSLKAVREKAQAFLNDPEAKELELFVVANWLFSLVFSGLATVFFLIFAGSFVYAAWQAIGRKLGFIKTRRQ